MKTVIVTTSWDDGHKEDVRLAKLLKRYNIPGTFYVAPKNREFPENELLTEQEIRELGRDFEIGAHTFTHPVLTRVTDQEAEAEIRKSKIYLEKLLGKNVDAFCYPRGAYSAQHIEMLRQAGFTYARTVRRHRLGMDKVLLEAETTLHAYDHWLDVWKIAKFADFNPFRFLQYFRHWDKLAMDMFDYTLKNGGAFHVWGHSWEIDKNNDWERLETVLRYISGRKEARYLNNSEIAAIKRKKKAIIATPYYPPHLGGTEFYAYNIAKGLQKDYDWEVCVITSAEKGMRMKIDYRDGVKTYALPYWLKISNTPINPLWPWMCKWIMKREDADICNAHAPVPGFADMLARMKESKPFVLTYHMKDMKKNRMLADIIINIYQRHILPATVKKSDGIIVASEVVKEYLAAFTAKEIEVITPGVDSDFFVPAVGYDNKNILFVGSLNKSDNHKGLEYLLKAMVLIMQKHPEAKLFVAGSGNNTDHLKSMARELGIDGAVHFYGACYAEQLRNAYQNAGIFVLPTLNDNRPLVISEAMSCALPVVSTTVGSIPTMVIDGVTGILVEPGNHTILAEKIIYLLDNPQLAQEMGMAGRKKVTAESDWHTRVAAYNTLLQRTIETADRSKPTSIEKNKPTIVHITPYYPPHLGGMEIVAREVAHKLQQNNFPVVVLTSDVGIKGAVPDRDEKNFTVKYLKSKEFAHTPIMWSLPFQLIFLPRHSIFHVHGAQAGIPEWAWLIARLRGIPLVVHFHLDVDASGKLGWLLPFYKKYFFAFVLRHTDRVIVLSQDQSRLVSAKYGVQASNISVIPNGVAERFFYAGKREDLSDRPLRILSVGRLSSQKRIDRLIAAVALLDFPVQLTIVGDGEDRGELEDLVKKLKLENVSFEGKKFGKELIAYYREADIFVISSDREGMPLTVLEAMAAGLPIVGSNVIGIRELIEGTGILVKDSSPQSFADALTVVRNDRVLSHHLAAQSREKAKQYTWDRLTALLAQVYKEIAK